MPSSLRQPMLRLAIAMASFFMISGCSTVLNADIDPLEITAASPLQPVVLSITANTGAVTGFDEIHLIRVREQRPKGEPKPVKVPGAPRIPVYFTLKEVARGLSRDTALFIGSLPAGEYYIDYLIDHSTQKRLTLSPDSPLLGHFVVAAGKPADLGRLIVTPMNTRVLYGRSQRVTSNLPLMQRFTPQHATLFAHGVAGGWKAGAQDQYAGAVETYAMARPVGADCISEMADGSVVAASRLGTILRRASNGRMSFLRSDGLESLLCVLPVESPDTELIAVGEFNTLFRQPRGVNRLLPIDTGNLPPGNLIRIEGNVANGWIVAQRRNGGVTLYQSKQLEGPWRVIRTDALPSSGWSGDTSFWMWKTATGIGYATSTGPLRFYDQAKAVWSEAPVPNDGIIQRISPSLNGALGMNTTNLGNLVASAWFSRDEGKSWKAVTAPFTHQYPVQFNGQGDVLALGETRGQPHLQISRDDGKTWAVHAPYEPERHFAVLKNGDLVDTDRGANGLFSIRSSLDGGKTWQTDYSNYDKAGAAARTPQEKGTCLLCKLLF